MLHNGISQAMSHSSNRPCRGRGRGKWLEYQNSSPVIPSIPLIKDDDSRSGHDIITSAMQYTRGKARKPEQQLYVPRPRRVQQQQQQQQPYPFDNDEYISPYCVRDNNDERGLINPTDDFYPHLFNSNPNNNNNGNTHQQTGRKNVSRAACMARKSRREVEIYIPRAKRLMQQGGSLGDNLGESGSLVNSREPASPLDRLSGEYSSDWTVGACQDVSLEVNRQGTKAGLQSLNVRHPRQSTVTHRSPESRRRDRQSKRWEYQSPSSSDDSGSSEYKVTQAPTQIEDRNRNRTNERKKRNGPSQPSTAGETLGSNTPENINKGTCAMQRCCGESCTNANVPRCMNERQINELSARSANPKTTLVNESTQVCDKTNVANSNPSRQQRRSPLSSCDPNKLLCESSKSKASNSRYRSQSPPRLADQDTKQGIVSNFSGAVPSSQELGNQLTPADRQCAVIPVNIPKEKASHSSKPPADAFASSKHSSSTCCKGIDNSAAAGDSNNLCPVILNKSKETINPLNPDNIKSDDAGSVIVKAAKNSSSSQELPPLVMSVNDCQALSGVDGDDEGADSWDALYDENGDCVDPTIIEELTVNVGKVQIQKTKINYLEFQPKETDLDFKEYDHVLEVYDFSADLQTRDLIGAFSQFKERGFDIKWVDDTHALAIFNSPLAAEDALSYNNPLLKVRRMADASKKSKQKAKRCTEFLQPYKPRPETSAITARRMVTGALGLTPRISKQKRDQERQQLKEAREKKRQDRLIKQEIWEGTIGSKCTVDATTQ